MAKGAKAGTGQRRNNRRPPDAPPMPTVRRIFPTGLRTNPVRAIQSELALLRTGLSYAETERLRRSGRMT